MEELFVYILKSAACMALLYAFYRLMLSSEKSLVFNRFYLLGSVVFSLVIPFITVRTNLFQLPWLKHKDETLAEVTRITVTSIPAEYVATVTDEPLISASELLFGIYIAVGLIFLSIFLMNLARLTVKLKKYPRFKDGDTSVVLTDEAHTPFSFMGHIFLNRDQYESGLIHQRIIEHEQVHNKQWHSLDVIFLEIVKIVFWFNPLIRMFKREIQLNHEYLADSHVLKNCSLPEYQETLLGFALMSQAGPLVSSLNNSFTKKRLIMMTKPRTSNLRIGGKATLLLPLLILAFAMNVSSQTQDPPSDEQKAREEAVRKEVEETRKKIEETKKEIVLVKENTEKEKARQDRDNVDATRKVIREEIILEGADIEELDAELESLMEELQLKMEDLNINMDDLKDDLNKKVRIQIEKINDGDPKVMIFSEDEDFEMDEDMEREIKVIVSDANSAGKTVKVIQEPGQKEKIIIIKSGDDTEESGYEWESEDGKVIIKSKGDGNENHNFNWVEESSDEQDVKVIIIKEEDTNKKKKKK